MNGSVLNTILLIVVIYSVPLTISIFLNLVMNFIERYNIPNNVNNIVTIKSIDLFHMSTNKLYSNLFSYLFFLLFLFVLEI